MFANAHKADTTAQPNEIRMDMPERIGGRMILPDSVSAVRYDPMSGVLEATIPYPRFEGVDPFTVDAFRNVFEAYVAAAYSEWIPHSVFRLTWDAMILTVYDASPSMGRRLAWLTGLAAPPSGWEDWRPIPMQATAWVCGLWEARLRRGYQWVR